MLKLRVDILIDTNENPNKIIEAISNLECMDSCYLDRWEIIYTDNCAHYDDKEKTVLKETMTYNKKWDPFGVKELIDPEPFPKPVLKPAVEPALKPNVEQSIDEIAAKGLEKFTKKIATLNEPIQKPAPEPDVVETQEDKKFRKELQISNAKYREELINL